jgi:hypothetical protein
VGRISGGFGIKMLQTQTDLVAAAKTTTVANFRRIDRASGSRGRYSFGDFISAHARPGR